MKVSTGYNPYAYQQQKTNTKHTGFADMLANQARAVKDTAAATYTSETKKSDAPAAAVNVQSSDRVLDFAKNGWDIFCKMESVDTTRPLNSDSLGDKELTEEQIAMLKEKYDVNNLSSQERYDLFCELTDMGVLSANDVRMTTMGNIFADRRGIVAHSESGYDSPWYVNIPKNDFASYIMAWVQQEQSNYDYMAELGGKLNELGEYEQRYYQNFQSNKQNIDYLTSSHQKVANVLSQLVRES